MALKKGVITGIITVLTFFLVKKFGTFAIGDATLTLNGEGMAMLAGTVVMLIFAATVKGDNSSANSDLVSVFS